MRMRFDALGVLAEGKLRMSQQDALAGEKVFSVLGCVLSTAEGQKTEGNYYAPTSQCSLDHTWNTVSSFWHLRYIR